MEHRAGISPQEQRPPFRYDILGLFQLGPYLVMGQVARKLAELGANVVCGRYVHLGFFHDPEVFDLGYPMESLAEAIDARRQG